VPALVLAAAVEARGTYLVVGATGRGLSAVRKCVRSRAPFVLGHD
jgi:hypothetical protein